MNESDDDDLQLCPTTLAALKEFLKEKEERENQLKHTLENQHLDVSFDENWQLSQFWYDDKTTDTLVKGAIQCTESDGKIALISCPTLYSKLKKTSGERKVTLFEYDERFKAYGSDFVPYNYKFPLNIPGDMSNFYDLVIADPPFLSDECLTKTALTIKFLAKKDIVLCTGAIMSDLAERLLNVKICNFVPQHRNNLANEFYCYSNFDFDKMLQ
ncbi:EEF1A lysine methyltransferase 1 [Bombus impatiens]|uniref:Protein-lysine N-methyltransferase LOC117206964 n=2 Tax=Pyrobombus TaxID=144703 RepID=A0A6P8LW46_9HYME|nr:EEF1A lysine methyltransferase 1 [Bombus impatiens]XP_012236352.1 EEF1A lysine methyltransferase 1 [Bombus impatiens]XP_033302603.1 EEF1A lysine methyltransferase 1 [Bombus bifarius]XP_033302604.1 EEF1A lysine methyltransferase 1 [Bombus bifarius]XP_050472749.1 EEF1A lysine methyltransferase 1 [Bombus huntii]XP_050472750.1 EEF1A lysine methyltransferase 1 [Bombus huntii]XP_050472751.1 EEF1A lysine methyltransferase 1 [Bombus huntii]